MKKSKSNGKCPQRLPSAEALRRAQEAWERPVMPSLELLAFGPLYRRRQ